VAGPEAKQPELPRTNVAGLAGVALLLALFVTAALVARRNLRLGRGDRPGGLRILVVGLLISFLGFGLLDKPRNVFDPQTLLATVCINLFFAAFIWATYLAVEPTIRRRWPERLTSWARLLGGRWRDPLVGRDLLIGVVASLGLALLFGLIAVSEGQSPYAGRLAPGGWATAGAVARSVGPGVLYPMMVLLLLGLARGLLRRPWAAVLAAFPVVTLLVGGAGSLLEGGVVAAVLVLLLLRYGLLSGIAAFTVAILFGQSVMTLHLTAWYADMSHAVLFTVLALAAWGLVAALGGARTTVRDRMAG
jgi:serine/threonine-protein kinase